jgi:hypothetical protein
MSVRFSIVLSGLLRSLAAIPASFAQNPPETSGSATGGTVAPAPAKDAPAAPGAQSAGNAESEAGSIASRIEAARKQGKDVSKAEAEEKQGEAALQAGYKAEAAQHFDRAKQDLGTM